MLRAALSRITRLWRPQPVAPAARYTCDDDITGMLVEKRKVRAAAERAYRARQTRERQAARERDRLINEQVRF